MRMIKRSYIVENTIACGMIISEILQGINCNIIFEKATLDDCTATMTIECETCDIFWVESMLEPFV